VCARLRPSFHPGSVELHTLPHHRPRAVKTENRSKESKTRTTMILLELRYSKQVHGGSAEILTSQNIQKWKKPGLTAHSRFISLWYHRYFDRLHRGIVNARDNGKRTTNFKLQPHCPFIVHSLFTVHSFVVHCPFIHCSLSIHCSFTVHSLFTFHFH